MENVDREVAAGFGREWSTFTQSEDRFSSEERLAIFSAYFRIFPWQLLPTGAVGIDIGCGSGRWSALVAPRVGHLHLLDPSPEALAVARTNLRSAPNTTFHLASVSDIPLPDSSLDFAFSLGVLHHVPDTQGAINAIAGKLKSGAPFLIYLYYALDNRPFWFRALWRASNLMRQQISRMPPRPKFLVSQFIAAAIYWPLARLSALVERLGFSSAAIPLQAYRDLSFYTMRTDAYDRFCTTLEKRFYREQIRRMLEIAGFTNITFSDAVPFWCAVGVKG